MGLNHMYVYCPPGGTQKDVIHVRIALVILMIFEADDRENAQ